MDPVGEKEFSNNSRSESKLKGELSARISERPAVGIDGRRNSENVIM